MKNKIEKIVTHIRAHQDEQYGIWMMKRFGENFFPGVRDAEILFLKNSWSCYPNTVIPIGIGYGEFDEHRASGPRLQNTCASILVAQRLRVANKPEINELLDEVYWCDTEPKVFPTQLANLIKAKHRVEHGENQHGTYRWVADAFDAIVCGGGIDRSFDIRQALEQFWHDGKWAMRSSLNNHSTEEVEKLVHGAHDRQNSFVTELAFIASVMKSSVRSNWLNAAFTLMIKDAEMYIEAIQEVNEKAQVIEINTDNGPEPVYMLATDNEHVTKAAVSNKTGKASMVIIRDSDGHTCVLANPTRKLMLADFAAMVRMAECQTGIGKTLSFEEADGPGTMPICPQWHLATGNMLLNGSLTHPEVVPSSLSLEQLGEIASAAFTKQGREEWINRYANAAIDSSLVETCDQAFEKK